MNTQLHFVLVAVILVMTFTACKDSENNTTSDIKVTTYAATEITATTAQVGGHVASTGTAKVTELGLCWSTEKDPTATDAHLSTTNVDEPFNCILTDLQPETQYHIRAYAFSEDEYHYGDDLTFITMAVGNDPELPEGALKGLFSVGESKVVRFSQGNLRYQASTNTWRFAESQTDYVGENNVSISETYSGWIDLFGWGTSGYNHGATCYQPWSTSEDFTSYYAYGNVGDNLYDDNGQADWGHNAISNGGNQAGLWRTLRNSEWMYLIEARQTTSGMRFALAVVGDANGLLLFPDDWDASLYAINEPNEFELDEYTVNTINASDWTNVLESAGVVFLPTAGIRVVTDVYYSNMAAAYWASTSFNSRDAYYFYFAAELGGDTDDVNQRNYGLSVRLVQDYNE